MEDLATKIFEGMHRAFDRWEPGTRPSHTRGIAAIGSFRGTPIAQQYCKADHFDTSWTPTVVRFSNSAGQETADTDPDVRGMAVKFFPGATLDDTGRSEIDGQRIIDHPPGVVGGDVHTDLIAISAPMFVTKTAEDLLGFEEASIKRPVKRRGLISKLRAMLRMEIPPPQFKGVESTNDDSLLAWAATYPPSHPFMAYAQGFTYGWSPRKRKAVRARPPDSYARMAYHAIHAFEVEAPCPDPLHKHVDGESCPAADRHMVRFYWDPLAGVRVADSIDQAPDYLHTELAHRLADAPIRFELRMQIADPSDDTTDPTRPWPANRRRILMGTLELTHLLPADECEQMAFNPGQLPDGIAMSLDPVLRARVDIYERSQRQRDADRCPMTTDAADR